MGLKKALDSFYYSTALCDLRLMTQQFGDKNITYNSLLYLELIFSMEGKCTASKIAELLNISKPAVTLKINELIKQGLVTKKPNPDDKRKNILLVNEDVMPKYKVYRKQDSIAIQRILENYSEDEIHKFCEMLNIISSVNYEKIDV